MLEDFQFHRELSKWQNLFDKDFFCQTQVGFLLFFQEEKDLLL